jgi:DNA-binding XRE family transcriptional regulator
VSEDDDKDFSKYNKVFGKKVKKYRGEEDMKQDELASAADITVTYLSGIENGKENPSLKVMTKISKKLKKYLPDMLKDEDDEEQNPKP